MNLHENSRRFPRGIGGARDLPAYTDIIGALVNRLGRLFSVTERAARQRESHPEGAPLPARDRRRA
jgi:hypothetical protein